MGSYGKRHGLGKLELLVKRRPYYNGGLQYVPLLLASFLLLAALILFDPGFPCFVPPLLRPFDGCTVPHMLPISCTIAHGIEQDKEFSPGDTTRHVFGVGMGPFPLHQETVNIII